MRGLQPKKPEVTGLGAEGLTFAQMQHFLETFVASLRDTRATEMHATWAEIVPRVLQTLPAIDRIINFCTAYFPDSAQGHISIEKKADGYELWSVRYGWHLKAHAVKQTWDSPRQAQAPRALLSSSVAQTRAPASTYLCQAPVQRYSQSRLPSLGKLGGDDAESFISRVPIAVQQLDDFVRPLPRAVLKIMDGRRSLLYPDSNYVYEPTPVSAASAGQLPPCYYLEMVYSRTFLTKAAAENYSAVPSSALTEILLAGFVTLEKLGHPCTHVDARLEKGSIAEVTTSKWHQDAFYRAFNVNFSSVATWATIGTVLVPGDKALGSYPGDLEAYVAYTSYLDGLAQPFNTGEIYDANMLHRSPDRRELAEGVDAKQYRLFARYRGSQHQDATMELACQAQG